MHPELEDQRAVIGQPALEFDDLVKPGPELDAAQPPMNTVDERTRVPGAQKKANAPLRRQVPPEPPVLGTLALLVGWLSVGSRQQPARIHPLVEKVDALALAGAVNTAKKDNHGRPARIAPPILHAEQFLAQRGDPRLVLGARHLPSQLGSFEHVSASLGEIPDRFQSGSLDFIHRS